jgi:lichenan operon transcriptional antiterminator
VQVVFLTAIGREEDENLQQFYEATTDLILRPADVQNLIRHPDYDRLIQLLRRAEE